MARDERRRDPLAQPEGLTHNPFAKAFGRSVPSAPPASSDGVARERHARVNVPQSKLARSAPSPPTASGANVVVQVERKGHGGKTVTRVRGLAPGQVGDLDEAARELRRALGAGARAEDGELVVQGEHVERVERWLGEHGVQNVVRGNR
jgi:translation initiation factor 1